MDYGRTTTPPPVTPTVPQTPEMGNGFFASAITPGVGGNPENINPDLENSLNADQSFNQINPASIGSRTLNLDPYLPPETSPNSAGIAGITEATRITSIDELGQPQRPNQPSPQSEEQAPSEPVELAQSLEKTDLKIETITPAEEPKDTHSTFDFGKRFTTNDIGKIESTIKKTNLTDLYNLIQNTREKDQKGGKN